MPAIKSSPGRNRTAIQPNRPRAPRSPQRGRRGREGRRGEPTGKELLQSHAQADRPHKAQRAQHASTKTPGGEAENSRRLRRLTPPGVEAAGPEAAKRTAKGGTGDPRKEPTEPERSKHDQRKCAAERMAKEGTAGGASGTERDSAHTARANKPGGMAGARSRLGCYARTATAIAAAGSAAP